MAMSDYVHVILSLLVSVRVDAACDNAIDQVEGERLE
jgi:hypothetical protein